MAREALLHIGMHKTGSTSIQRTFRRYKDEEWRFANLGHPNHSRSLTLAFRENPADSFYNGEDPATLRKAERRRLVRQLKRDQRSVILSGQGLSYFPERDVVGLLNFLSEHVDRIRLICYLREPAAMVASSFQQLVKRRLPDLNHGRRFPRYKKRCAPWLHHVGADNCQFALFDREALKNGDLLQDFAARVGISESYAIEHAKSANVGVSAELTALLLAARFRLRDIGGKANHQRVSQVVRRLGDFGSSTLAFSPESLKEDFDRNADQVVWAEEAMQTRFPQPGRSNQVCVNSFRDLLDLAETVGPEFAESCQKAGLDIPGNSREDPVGAMAAWLQGKPS